MLRLSTIAVSIAFLAVVPFKRVLAENFEGVYFSANFGSVAACTKESYEEGGPVVIRDGVLYGSEWACELSALQRGPDKGIFQGDCSAEGSPFTETFVISRTNRGISIVPRRDRVPEFDLIDCDPTRIAKPSVASNIFLSSFHGIMFNQLSSDDVNLYVSRRWAETNDAIFVEYKHFQLSCLATVYAMIEHARGNTSYRVGAEQTWVSNGPVAIAGTGPGRTVERNKVLVVSELKKGNPVILRGKSPRFGDLPQHFVVVVGLDHQGDFIALDPYGGNQITVSSEEWTSRGSSAGSFTVVDMRLVTF